MPVAEDEVGGARALGRLHDGDGHNLPLAVFAQLRLLSYLPLGYLSLAVFDQLRLLGFPLGGFHHEVTRLSEMQLRSFGERGSNTRRGLCGVRSHVVRGVGSKPEVAHFDREKGFILFSQISTNQYSQNQTDDFLFIPFGSPRTEPTSDIRICFFYVNKSASFALLVSHIIVDGRAEFTTLYLLCAVRASLSLSRQPLNHFFIRTACGARARGRELLMLFQEKNGRFFSDFDFY
mmetsp:Transcript_14240/g.23395  ORF Transcript_14240/g.23395 Transcript_14240/m.23395 type:complete len:234 (-) Transcript_14240:86-787(-)